MSKYDRYIASAGVWNVWDEVRFNSRCKALAEVWEERGETNKRKLLAIIVAHAPEIGPSEVTEQE